jgi:hypothetical protein
VRGTVRDKNNAKKIDPIRKAFTEELFNKIDLVEMDLLNEESIIQAAQGC